MEKTTTKIAATKKTLFSLHREDKYSLTICGKVSEKCRALTDCPSFTINRICIAMISDDNGSSPR